MSQVPDLVVDRPRPTSHLIERLLSVAVTTNDDRETIRLKRLLAGVLWISLATSAVGIAQLVAVSLPLAAWSIGAVFLTSLWALAMMWIWPSSFPNVVHGIVAMTILVSAVFTVLFGGFLDSGANALWGLLPVFGALALFADWRATTWLVIYAAVTIASAVIASGIEPIYTLPNPEYFALFNLVVVLMFTYFLLLYYVRQRKTLLAQSDDLLRNILPDEVAERLKASGDRIADEYESVSILFADVADFTPMSAAMSPTELVDVLNEVFTMFDDLVDRRDLEKIKTIGDAYMVASGVPVPRDDHAVVICDLALAMQESVAAKEFAGHRLEFRIGISSGPVVAGIIGQRKFSYDLWGDAVNMASRMESSGTAGRIQITQGTCNLVASVFECESLGNIDVKGLGPTPAWTLVGRI